MGRAMKENMKRKPRFKIIPKISRVVRLATKAIPIVTNTALT
jgi:hypothetical protein